MTGELLSLIGKYRSKGILLDSNLLVLLFVGLTSPELVADFKRTRNQAFTAQEFELLRRIVASCTKVVTTPHVLTETSNFLGMLEGKYRVQALTIFSHWVEECKERHREAQKLVQATEFFSFGLTDSAILDLPSGKYLVLSVDAALVVTLQKKGIDAINFNHLRQLAWQQ